MRSLPATLLSAGLMITAALAKHSQTSDDFCEHVTRETNGIIVVRGPARILGIEMTNTRLTREALVINGVDIYDYIRRACPAQFSTSNSDGQ